MKRLGKGTNIETLRNISNLFQTTSLGVDELLAMVMNTAKDIVGVKNGSLLLVQDEKTCKLQFYQASGKNMGQLKDIDLPPGVGISGHVVKTGKPIISNDVSKDPRWFQGVSEKMHVPVQSMASFPLLIDKKVIGVVQFLDKVDGTTFNDKNIEVLEQFAHLMAKFFQVSQNRNLLNAEFGKLKEQYLHRYTIVGESKAIQKCIKIAEKVADSKAAILLTGESGTGKELFAHLIHDRGNRQDKPFISVSCGALPASILERELFGHEKGAFTGADSQKIGLFEAADKGTLFLDELGEMPLDMQVKLLRVIQEESFIRLGGTETIKVDVRLITATNRDLDKEVHEGNFRQDLFYRVNVIKIMLPPLREKLEDISDLLIYFLKKHKPENQPIKKPGKGLVSHLMSYSWPGNIRELENSVERAIVLTDEEELLPEAFPFEISQAPIELNVGSSLKDASDSFRRTFISNTLKSTEGNRTKAAQILDVQRSYLSRLIKELGIK
jgi:transcriptional regulator with GAF, ATPase, and Fis domain